MVRLVSLAGLAILAVAAVAVATTPRAAAEEPQSANDFRGKEPQSRLPAGNAQRLLSFHAPFSLN